MPFSGFDIAECIATCSRILRGSDLPVLPILSNFTLFPVTMSVILLIVYLCSGVISSAVDILEVRFASLLNISVNRRLSGGSPLSFAGGFAAPLPPFPGGGGGGGPPPPLPPFLRSCSSLARSGCRCASVRAPRRSVGVWPTLGDLCDGGTDRRGRCAGGRAALGGEPGCLVMLGGRDPGPGLGRAVEGGRGPGRTVEGPRGRGVARGVGIARGAR
jgi:hypothetical protein